MSTEPHHVAEEDPAVTDAAAPPTPAEAPPATPLDRFVDGFWTLFSSVWTAVTIMLVIVGMSVVGTFVGWEAADPGSWYRAWFFELPLLLLMVNITVCTLSRYPWRLSQAPFLIVHVGLLTVIASFIVSEKLALRDGQIMLREGEQKKEIYDARERVLIAEVETLPEGFDPGPGHGFGGDPMRGHGVVRPGATRTTLPPRRSLPVTYPIDLDYHKSGRRQDDLADLHTLDGDGLAITIDKHYPSFSPIERMTNDGERFDPAARIVMRQGPLVEDAWWLIASQPSRSAVVYGPAVVSYHVVPTRDLLDLTVDPEPVQLDYDYPGEAGAALGTIHILVGSEEKSFPIADAKTTVAHRGFQVFVNDFFADFAVGADGRPTTRSDEAKNPALQIEIQTPKGRRYRRYLFGTAEAKQANVHADPGLPFEDRSLNFVTVLGARAALPMMEQASHFLVRKNPDAPMTVEPVEVGEPIALRGPGLEVTLEEYYARARPMVEFRSLPKKGFNDAVHVMVTLPGQNLVKETWVVEGPPGEEQVQEVVIGNKLIRLRYTYKRIALGFEIGLDELRVNHYPGSDKVRDIESFVWARELPPPPKKGEVAGPHGEAPGEGGSPGEGAKSREGDEKPGEGASPGQGDEPGAAGQKPGDGNGAAPRVPPSPPRPKTTGHVYMNSTFDYGGYRFFQFSFAAAPDGRQISILEVTRDPGGPIFYVGLLILVFGVGTIFWLKPSLRRIEAKRRAAPGGRLAADAQRLAVAAEKEQPEAPAKSEAPSAPEAPAEPPPAAAEPPAAEAEGEPRPEGEGGAS